MFFDVFCKPKIKSSKTKKHLRNHTASKKAESHVLPVSIVELWQQCHPRILSLVGYVDSSVGPRNRVFFVHRKTVKTCQKLYLYISNSLKLHIKCDIISIISLLYVDNIFVRCIHAYKMLKSCFLDLQHSTFQETQESKR